MVLAGSCWLQALEREPLHTPFPLYPACGFDGTCTQILAELVEEPFATLLQVQPLDSNGLVMALSRQAAVRGCS